MSEEKKPKRTKRMFVVLEIETTLTAREIALALRPPPDRVRLMQVHVNVAKKEKQRDDRARR